MIEKILMVLNLVTALACLGVMGCAGYMLYKINREMKQLDKEIAGISPKPHDEASPQGGIDPSPIDEKKL